MPPPAEVSAKSLFHGVTGVPCCTEIDETIELKAAPILIIELVVKAQFDRACDTIVAANLGGAVTTAERDPAKVELL